MSGGWGRRAAGKVDRNQGEDDALIRAIGDQLGTGFDYTQWQRTHKPKSRSPVIKQKSATPTFFDVSDGDFTVGRGGSSRNRVISAGSSLCRHQHHSKKDSPQPIDPALQKKKLEQITILQLRVQARRRTVEEYRKRCETLLVENMKLQKEIQSMEDLAHGEVKSLLRKYEKFRGGIGTISSKFEKEYEESVNDLENTRQKMEAELSFQQKQVDDVETRLQKQQQELHVLMNYKDKEYPVKAIKITDLQKEIEQLKISNEEDEEELNHIVDSEIEKLHTERLKMRNEITETITDKNFAQMHPSLKEMATQNLIMTKEIEVHKKDIASLEEGNQVLEKAVKQLLKDPKTNAKMQIFPEFFPKTKKCTPDMEVILDIPTQEWLPI